VNEPKPFASLSSSLLARKGQARPAMRPQSLNALDDLGWNDMGAGGSPAATPIPAVIQQQQDIAHEFGTPAEPETTDVEPAAGAQAAVGGKAAFTLRLDAERHLKLRIACAMRNRSAQMIVTEALDAYLNALPDIDAVAGSFPVPLPRRARTKRGVEE
jgi:hypothetical protein